MINGSGQSTIRPTNQKADVRVHREVTLPISVTSEDFAEDVFLIRKDGMKAVEQLNSAAVSPRVAVITPCLNPPSHLHT